MAVVAKGSASQATSSAPDNPTVRQVDVRSWFSVPEYDQLPNHDLALVFSTIFDVVYRGADTASVMLHKTLAPCMAWLEN
jgi:hypothetical protein